MLYAMEATVRTPEAAHTARATAGSRPGAPGPLTLTLLALAALFLAGTVVMTVVAASLASDLHGEGDRRDAVSALSSSFGARFLTYDGARLADARRSVAELSTARLRGDYASAMAKVGPALESSRSQARATVTGVYVGDLHDRRAASVVTVDVVVRAAAQPERRQRQVLALTLVRAGGDWRVDAVTDLRTTPATTTAATS
jgi:hypothetical protein